MGSFLGYLTSALTLQPTASRHLTSSACCGRGRQEPLTSRGLGAWWIQKIRRELRLQGVEARRAAGLLLVVRFRGVAVAAEDLQIGHVVAAALGERLDVVHLLAFGERVVADAALVSLVPAKLLKDFWPGVFALVDEELVHGSVHERGAAFALVLELEAL